MIEEYRNSEERKREEAFSYYGRRCQRCGSEENLDAYRISGNALDSESGDFAVLCHDCHRNLESRQQETKQKIEKLMRTSKYAEFLAVVAEKARPLLVDICQILADADTWFFFGRKTRHKPHLQSAFWKLFPEDGLLAEAKRIRGGAYWHEVFLKKAAGTYRDEQQGGRQ